eukprot:Platyproteum_vivax@DN879_c0_g1_i3.p1
MRARDRGDKDRGDRDRDRERNDRDRNDRDRGDRDRGPARRDYGGPVRRNPAYNYPRIDREKQCPFLLRVFYKENGQNELDDFAVRGKEPTDRELQIYTWPDVTLKELSDLVKDVLPEARSRDANFEYRLIYPDRSGKNFMTKIGEVHSIYRNFEEDMKTLTSVKFQIGDFVDLSITYRRRTTFGGPPPRRD